MNIKVEILKVKNRTQTSKSNKKSFVYFKISTSASYEQYKVKCLQKKLQVLLKS